LLEKTDEEVIGIRTGEKLHEILINEDELRNTFDLDNKYVILKSDIAKKASEIYPGIKESQLNETYSSNNAERISKEELKKIIMDVNIL